MVAERNKIKALLLRVVTQSIWCAGSPGFARTTGTPSQCWRPPDLLSEGAAPLAIGERLVDDQMRHDCGGTDVGATGQ